MSGYRVIDRIMQANPDMRDALRVLPVYVADHIWQTMPIGEGVRSPDTLGLLLPRYPEMWVEAKCHHKDAEGRTGWWAHRLSWVQCEKNGSAIWQLNALTLLNTTTEPTRFATVWKWQVAIEESGRFIGFGAEHDKPHMNTDDNRASLWCYGIYPTLLTISLLNHKDDSDFPTVEPDGGLCRASMKRYGVKPVVFRTVTVPHKTIQVGDGSRGGYHQRFHWRSGYTRPNGHWVAPYTAGDIRIGVVHKRYKVTNHA